MPLTIHDLTPIGLCIATQELFDIKRFRELFADFLIYRVKDKDLEKFILPLKRELNSNLNQKKFLEGHKAVIINNIDKILNLVYVKYSNIDMRAVEGIIVEGKEIIKKVLLAESFESLAKLETVFKNKITLPVYSLFSRYEKQRS
ncbi:MAG: hypothetical protein QXQ18_00685 [Candidatus Aenigmatarchaeota archaeon]